MSVAVPAGHKWPTLMESCTSRYGFILDTESKHMHLSSVCACKRWRTRKSALCSQRPLLSRVFFFFLLLLLMPEVIKNLIKRNSYGKLLSWAALCSTEEGFHSMETVQVHMFLSCFIFFLTFSFLCFSFHLPPASSVLVSLILILRV